MDCTTDLQDMILNLFVANNFWDHVVQERIRYIRCVLWWIWKQRCHMVFDKVQFKPSDSIVSVKNISMILNVPLFLYL